MIDKDREIDFWKTMYTIEVIDRLMLANNFAENNENLIRAMNLAWSALGSFPKQADYWIGSMHMFKTGKPWDEYIIKYFEDRQRHEDRYLRNVDDQAIKEFNEKLNQLQEGRE